MADDPDIIRARLSRRAYLGRRALITPPEDRARMDRMIQFICRALQLVAWVRQRTVKAKHQRKAAEVSALYRRIVEQVFLMLLSAVCPYLFFRWRGWL